MNRTLDWIIGIASIQLGFALGAAGTLSTSASAQAIAFTNVRIVDGNERAPVEHGTIVIEGRKIVAVGPTSSISIPSQASTIDGGGRTAMPGLADMHVHSPGQLGSSFRGSVGLSPLHERFCMPALPRSSTPGMWNLMSSN